MNLGFNVSYKEDGGESSSFYNKKTNLDVRDFHDSDNRNHCGMVCAAQRDPVGCS